MMESVLKFMAQAREITFGWRKLGVLIGLLVTMLVWLFLQTYRTPAGAAVPDVPVTWAGLVGGLYLVFVAGNWGVHKANATKGEPKP